MKNAIQVFHDWSLNGKDEGMEKVHSSSVEEMLTFVLQNIKQPFSFIDAGCGNGWVVRRVLSHPLCKSAIGIDGATGMIEKAKTLDSEGTWRRLQNSTGEVRILFKLNLVLEPQNLTDLNTNDPD